MNDALQKGLSSLENLIRIQRDCIPERSNPAADYMHGMLNGLICAHSAMAGDIPHYYSRSISRKRRINIRHKSVMRRLTK